ncbi:MAG: hypothetical protein LUD68_09190 [Rikenellaceae bacterium]|nr:hypothetical protein [Rikenellaceae bacterium]
MIHGHPQYAGYTFIGGRFTVEVFQQQSDRLTACQLMDIDGKQGFPAISRPAAFVNPIYRLTCLSEKGYSLHIYSDDALKGFKYDDPNG